jgi:hypothetical protein
MYRLPLTVPAALVELEDDAVVVGDGVGDPADLIALSNVNYPVVRGIYQDYIPAERRNMFHLHSIQTHRNSRH